MKKYLIIVFLLCASAGFAQPVIDSMLIDEMKFPNQKESELRIYGSFGNLQGKVWGDSVEMHVSNWTDSLVKASIPDTGRGSAGPVVIGASGYQSAPRVITLWEMKIKYTSEHLYDVGSSSATDNFDLLWRLDLHSMLKNKNATGSLYLSGMSSSKTEQRLSTSITINGKTTSGYTDTTIYPYIYYASFYFQEHKLGLQATLYVYSDGSPNSICSYDSVFNLLPKDTTIHLTGEVYWETVLTPQMTLFPPPAKAIALQNNPSIIDPKDNSFGTGTDDIILRWDSLALMDKYHLQVSLDSLFSSTHSHLPQTQSNKIIVDTIISATEFALSPLAKNTQYFWRVAGVNSEGESRWSNTWNFTTGSKANVTTNDNSQLMLSAFPNPSSNELTVNYMLPDNEHGRIVLYDLQGKMVREYFDKGNASELKWNISELRSGTYILGLITPSKQLSQMVLVVH
jgi:hypothetical protein